MCSRWRASPLLANPVVAEVALLDEPSPQDGGVEVPLWEPVTLTYDSAPNLLRPHRWGSMAFG